MSTTIKLTLKEQAFGSVAVVTRTGWFFRTKTDTYDCVRGPNSDSGALWADRSTGLLADFKLMDKINDEAHVLREYGI